MNLMNLIRPNSAARSTALLALAMSVAISSSAYAADVPNKAAEFAIKYRKSLYTTMYGNFAPLGAVVKGAAPYDAKAFTVKAERVAFLSVMAADAFPAESQSGAPTNAKPEIWTNRTEFDKLMKNWQDKTAALAKVSQDGKLDAIKPAFGAVAEACKACHDKFRVEEKH